MGSRPLTDDKKDGAGWGAFVVLLFVVIFVLIFWAANQGEANHCRHYATAHPEYEFKSVFMGCQVYVYGEWHSVDAFDIALPQLPKGDE